VQIEATSTRQISKAYIPYPLPRGERPGWHDPMLPAKITEEGT